ncbi:MAG: hydroxylamine reductase [Planctomycetia bacterium]
MFCYQCEQTAGGQCCTKVGVCGKQAPVAALQDLLVQVSKDVAVFAGEGDVDPRVDRFLADALFTTVTNVNFDEARVIGVIHEGLALREELIGALDTPVAYKPFEVPGDEIQWADAARAVSIQRRREAIGETLAGLQELILYGLKGAAAYAHHARTLGVSDPAIDADFRKILRFLAQNPQSVDDLLGNALATGELNYRVMEALDRGNTDKYGHPEPTAVRVTPVPGKCILVSGHDLADLELLLKQTEGRGINVYTHGEMLPCLAYPGLKKYPHLVGNYGGAWQDQAKEFDAFPGPILMTTNCIQKPRETYKNRIFTTGLVAWPDVSHIDKDKDFSPVVEAALEAEGFTEATVAEYGPEHTITIGFARNTVMSVAGQVIEAVKSGAVRHFFLIGGCDGAKPGRNYFTDLAQAVPDDCIILTLACGKYRFNKLDFGTIGGIPRLLDIGQCNDAYSAIQIAVALAGAFECGVNDLPLSMVLSWYEQKAVAILLTLLHLGVTNIKLGPSLPAFVTPDVLNVLVEKFQIAPITTPEEDLKAILG